MALKRFNLATLIFAGFLLGVIVTKIFLEPDYAQAQTAKPNQVQIATTGGSAGSDGYMWVIDLNKGDIWKYSLGSPGRGMEPSQSQPAHYRLTRVGEPISVVEN